LKVPNIANGVVSQEKVVGYLLRMPPDGAPQSQVFKGPIFREALGWSEETWWQLSASLKEIGVNNEVVQVRERPHGINYRVDGDIQGPNGRRRVVRTIWHVDMGSDVPRLVSAY